MWLQIILLIIFLYLLGGLPKIVSDITKPSFNRPLYTRNPILVLFVLVAWLPLRVMQIKELGIKRLWQIERESKFLEGSMKEGKSLKEIEELLKKRGK